MPVSKKQKPLPVVRLNLAEPFFSAASAKKGNLNKTLHRWGLTPEDFADPGRFVPARTMYELVEVLGGLTGDDHAGVTLGAQLNPFEWKPLRTAAARSTTLGELLLRFSIDAFEEATSVTFILSTNGDRTTFSERRVLAPEVPLPHNDAFGAAYTLSILRGAVGARWSGREVVVAVSDPTVFPSNYWGIRLATADYRGFKVSFPTSWMLLKPNMKSASTRKPASKTLPAPSDLLESLRIVLGTGIADATLTTERIATLCGVSSRTLARQLSQRGTSVKKELDSLRSSTAISLLSGGELSIAEIGKRVGYADPSVFSRTFKRWTGDSPRDFRKRNGS